MKKEVIYYNYYYTINNTERGTVVNIQFKKGVLELCVLALLEKGDRYGYDIAAAFGERIDISDGTVYPILRRLLSDAYLSSYIKESSGGPPRKYYAITEKGRNFLIVLESEWRDFANQVNLLIEEEAK